jgi:predicted nuclease with TOPRIM domain
MFTEDKFIKDGQNIIKKIEDNLRLLKIEYQKTLGDYNQLKTGNPEVFEEMEPKYLQLLSKLQKSIEDTMNLWDRTIASVEKMKVKKKETAEYFLAGVIWALDQAEVDPEKKKEIIEIAKKLILPPTS